MELYSLVQSIEEVARCPICVELFVPPVTLCENGHGTCSQCKSQITSCSLCKANFINTTPRILNEILQLIPKLCKFSALGCKAIASNDHEVYCEFREVKCIVGKDKSCTWRGQFKDWKYHIDSDHTSHNATYSVNCVTVLNYPDFRKSWRVKVYHHTVDSKTFILYTFKNRNQFYQTFRIVADKKQDCVYYFKICFYEGDELVFQHRVEATLYDEEEDMENSPNCMAVAINELSNMVVNDNLTATIFVTSKKR